MSVGTFVQPAFGSQLGDDYKEAIDNSIAAMARIGAAFAPHEAGTPDMTVVVDAGALWVNGAPVEVAAQSSATITAPTTNPRIDRVVIDALTGAVSVVTGTEAVSPAAPVIPSGKLPVCQVALATTTTAIDNSLITDERILGGGSAEAYKVGGLYLETIGADPAVTLGYGTWVLSRKAAIPFSAYPPAQSGTYVKATTTYTTEYPYQATDPTKLLTGGHTGRTWLANTYANQRFHIDLGTAKKIVKIYYENYHNAGANTNRGAKTFTLWGSNNAAAFADLTYGTDTNWTQLTSSQATFDQHVALDQADPKYITVNNLTAYRYYALKIADNWGAVDLLGLRRIELQTADFFDWERTA